VREVARMNSPGGSRQAPTEAADRLVRELRDQAAEIEPSTPEADALMRWYLDAADLVAVQRDVIADQEKAIRHALAWLDTASLALAFWCPHGMDSSRSAEYNTAADVRVHLDKAIAALKAEAVAAVVSETEEKT
jgi:hypothetical protein